MQSQLNQLKANPAKYLVSRRINIPEGMANSPQQMIEAITGIPITPEYANNPNAYFQYMLSNGQLSPQQQNQYMSAAKFFNF